MTDSVLKSAMSHGGRTSRYADLVVVMLHSCSFVTTALEYQAAQTWARGKMGTGVAHRDRMMFVDRFLTLIGRNGSGVATKGGKSALQGMVTGMKQRGMQLEEWMIPRDLYESLEVKRKPKVAEAAAELLDEAPVVPALKH